MLDDLIQMSRINKFLYQNLKKSLGKIEKFSKTEEEKKFSPLRIEENKKIVILETELAEK